MGKLAVTSQVRHTSKALRQLNKCNKCPTPPPRIFGGMFRRIPPALKLF